jgi:hypothetical protein
MRRVVRILCLLRHGCGVELLGWVGVVAGVDVAGWLAVLLRTDKHVSKNIHFSFPWQKQIDFGALKGGGGLTGRELTGN